MSYSWTSQRSALPASLQSDLKSDHGTVCPSLGEKEPYARRVRDQALAASCSAPRSSRVGVRRLGCSVGRKGDNF